MIASWNVMFVHPDENFKVTAELYENAKKVFGVIGWLLHESEGEDGSYAAFNPREVNAAISARDGGRLGYVPFTVCVRYFASRLQRNDMMRRGIAKLVARWLRLAKCSGCGVEEEPSEWKIGPPEVLYTRSFEIGYQFEGGPDLCTESDQLIETKLREYMSGAVERVERVTGAVC
jgi:hypothetical protein